MKGLFWKVWAVLLVLSILWLASCIESSRDADAQAGIPDEIRATAFVLVDDEGNQRATLDTLEGGPRLVLLDGQGETRAELRVDHDGTPSLWLWDAQGEIRAELSVFAYPDGTPVLRLYHAQGGTRAELSVLPDGPAALELYDAQGEAGAGLYVQADGLPALGLYDAQGEVLFSAP